ncbi:MAG TPA: cation diffusion facilitator family transporter [Chthoniobacteraceae bacterium]|jgi:cation diffusion facilitator family transporter|nr:cation diffusion facilitator family transporter [Chthoniobacteraceae bacterium]
MRSTSRKLESGARLALRGLRLNAGLCVVKIGVGLIGHSYAMIADGVESLLDVLSSLLIWAGLKYAQRPPDSTHPYGHGKAEPVAAILGSLLILSAAVGLGVASVMALGSPRPAPRWFTLAVLMIVVVVKEIHSRRVEKLARETQSLAMEADAMHHRADAITSAAAVVGIGVALIGGRKYESADNWAAMFACAVIAFNGLRIFWPSVADLMDTAPPNGIDQQVRASAVKVEGVEGTDQCRVRKMGLEYYVDLHVKVNGAMTVTEGHGIAHKVKDAIRQEVPEVADVLVHIEPA